MREISNKNIHFQEQLRAGWRIHSSTVALNEVDQTPQKFSISPLTLFWIALLCLQYLNPSYCLSFSSVSELPEATCQNMAQRRLFVQQLGSVCRLGLNGGLFKELSINYRKPIALSCFPINTVSFSFQLNYFNIWATDKPTI